MSRTRTWAAVALMVVAFVVKVVVPDDSWALALLPYALAAVALAIGISGRRA